MKKQQQNANINNDITTSYVHQKAERIINPNAFIMNLPENFEKVINGIKRAEQNAIRMANWTVDSKVMRVETGILMIQARWDINKNSRKQGDFYTKWKEIFEGNYKLREVYEVIAEILSVPENWKIIDLTKW